MTNELKHERTARRIAEAVAWHSYLHESELTSTPDFESWLKDRSNAYVWGQVVSVWDFLGDQAKEPELVSARTRALLAVKRAMAQRRAIWSWQGTVAAVAAAGLLIAVGVQGFNWARRPADYTTGFGERRIVRLEDGSRISLDSDSEVTVRYTRYARSLHLLKGQARFDVAHDVERPFSVVARDRKVVATGTAFNIDLTRPNVSVTLIEGHVVVLDATGDAQSVQPSTRKVPLVELHAGQELVATNDKASVVKDVNIKQVTAWVSGQLVFTNETLSDVVARVNRYSTTPIVIADSDLADEKVSGVFNVGDVPGFLDIITQTLPLSVSDDQRGVITLSKK